MATFKMSLNFRKAHHFGYPAVSFWGSIIILGGGFNHFLSSPLPGEMIKFA